MPSDGAIHVISRTARDLEVPLPEPLLAQIAKARAFVAAAEDVDGSPIRLHEGVLDAIAANRDYATDKAIHRLLVGHLLGSHGFARAADERADRDIRAALTEHADALLAAWSNTLAPHSAAIVAAAAALSSDDLDDVQSVTRQGPAALRSWADAREARTLFESATRGAMTLASVAHVNTDGRHGRALMLVDPDLAVLDEIRRSGAHLDAWTLARAGATPRLACGLGEYMERVSILAQQQQAVLDAAVDAEKHPRAAART